MTERKGREESRGRSTPAGAGGGEDGIRPAAGGDLALLARLHGLELDGELLERLRSAPFAELFALVPEDGMGREACEVIDRGWEVLDEGDPERMLDRLAADFAALYLTHRHRVSPDESVWLDDDGLVRQRPMLEVREWYARFGVAAPDWRKVPDDNIALQLAFVSHLMTAEDDEGGWLATPEDVARFLDDHLLLWLDDFASAAASRCHTPFYAGLAIFTAAWMRAFREVLARITGIAPLTPEERAARRKRPEEAPQPAEGPYVPGMGPAV